MSTLPHTDTIPLRQDPTGALRVGDSRVLYELVIHAFQDGATPEAIVDSYATTNLADIYAVLGYYLRHQPEVAEYLRSREALATEVRERIEQHQGDLADTRKRILARRGA